jgi:clan AA aspartic protease (TIGR02281 family)
MRLLPVCLFAILQLVSAEVRAQCGIPPVATLRLSNADRPIVMMMIQGRPMPMLLDTGAEVTTVTPESVRALGLAIDPTHRTVISGVGGKTLQSQAILNDIAVAGIDFGRHSAPVVALDKGASVAGLAGMDLFGRYDLDLDFPAQRLTLYPATACSPAEPLWPRGTYVTVATLPNQGRRILVRAGLNGQAVSALVDTGSQSGLVTNEAAERAGLNFLQIESGAAGRGVGAANQAFKTRLSRFGSLSVGSETFRDVSLQVANFRQEGVDMLLGMNFLRTHRVFITLASNRLFMQRPADAQSDTPPQPAAAENCRPPERLLPILSRFPLVAISRPRLPVPARVQQDRIDGCAGVTFQVMPDGSTHVLRIEVEWPQGYGLGDFVRRELDATRFQPPAEQPGVIHYESHRLHIQ